MKDPLGDKLKAFERAGETFPTGDKPIVIRLDGKNFSKFTKRNNFVKPFDLPFATMMLKTTQDLVDYCDADIGYTQSDEITLILTKKHQNHELFFGGRFQKLASVLASLATYKFNVLLNAIDIDSMALFDCRVFEVPDKETAIECLDWRAEDCRRNSVSCLAQSQFSHKELHGVSCRDMKLMLKNNDTPWEDIQDIFKNGSYIKRHKVKAKFTTEELEALPEKHQARQNPDLEFERTEYKVTHDSILDTKDKEGFVW
jgi:tRNA(His) 5'-end guanylyltransferase